MELPSSEEPKDSGVKFLAPRSYQLEMLDESMRQNIIVAVN